MKVDDDNDDFIYRYLRDSYIVYIKQLYFFSGFNSGPVYHLRVVEQKLRKFKFCFEFNLQ